MTITPEAVEAARKAFNDCRITDIDSLNNLFRTIIEAAEPFITAELRDSLMTTTLACMQLKDERDAICTKLATLEAAAEQEKIAQSLNKPDGKPDDADLATIAYFSGAADARDTIKALRAQIAKIEAAAEPFATVGRMIGGPFGPALFPDDEMAFRKGCTWSEDGEKHILTWGYFRDLCDVLKNGEHNV